MNKIIKKIKHAFFWIDFIYSLLKRKTILLGNPFIKGSKIYRCLFITIQMKSNQFVLRSYWKSRIEFLNI